MTDPLPWAAARQAAHGLAALAACTLALESAEGAVLAAPVHALSDLPPADTSAMDGYAVRGSGPWLLLGRTLAGHGVPQELSEGSAWEVSTGTVVPAGSEGVVRSEDGSLHGDQLEAPHPGGRNVRRQGEECRAGDLLAPGEALVSAVLQGLLAAVGHDTVIARPPPLVRLVVSGNELITTGSPAPGQVRDAIGPMLPGLVRGCGGSPGPVRRIADDPAAFHDALALGPERIVVTTGASGRGPADHLRPVLAELGATLLVDSVRCRPGHPMLLAQLPDGRCVVGLPGNPLAAVAATLTLLAPALRALVGRPLDPLPALPCAEPLTAHPRDTRLVPVRIAAGRVRPCTHTGAGMLRGLAAAQALAVVPPGSDATAAVGSPVELLVLPGAHPVQM
jgi:molybdopterin molybdotransferase